MKVAIITDPCYFPSGVKTYVDNLVENLLMIHDETYIVHSKKDGELFPSARQLILPSLYRSSAAAMSIFDIHRPVLLRKYRFDVVHYTHNHVPLSFWASGSKTICTVHGVASLSHPQFHSIASRILWRVSALLNRRIDVVLADSNYAKEAIIQFLGVRPEKIRVIYHGVGREFKPQKKLNETKDELDSKFGIGAPFILNVNGYRPIKNVVTLVKAFAEIKKLGIQHKLVLVGKPIDPSHEAMKAIMDLGLEKEVVITGYVPKKDLLKLYGLADLYVIPSFKESFGLPLLEAMACGCPVIASNVTALPEVGGDAVVFFDPYNYEELAKKMYRLLTNNELRSHFSRKALERARQFSWEKCAQEHLDVYNEVCQQT